MIRGAQLDIRARRAVCCLLLKELVEHLGKVRAGRKLELYVCPVPLIHGGDHLPDAGIASYTARRPLDLQDPFLIRLRDHLLELSRL